MKVKCITNDLNNITDKFLRDRLQKWSQDFEDHNLKVNSEYHVYGIHTCCSDDVTIFLRILPCMNCQNYWRQ